MPRTTPLSGRAVLLVALIVLALAAPALAAHSQPESWQALTRQADSGQVASALIVPSKKEVRVRLKNGSHYIALYPAGSTPAAIQSSLQSHGAAATIHKTAAKSSGHVRYRYIALAILALGALAALGYYLLRGRPTSRSAAGPGDAAPLAEPPAPSPPAATHGVARGDDPPRRPDG